jgi:uncharacterized protein YndB with AHSA1/START domain
VRVSDTELFFSRDYDLPAVIVWDALVDEVLVGGWLAPARVDATLGGEYFLEWQNPTGLGASNGLITDLDPLKRLAVQTDNAGTLDFSLESIKGGSRGTFTALTVRVVVGTDRRLLASTRADWLSNLDQLEELLRGHPVDWSTWQEDRGEAWSQYLRASR